VTTIYRMKYRGEDMEIQISTYPNGNTAVSIHSNDSGPYAKLSINAVDDLPRGEFVVSHDVSDQMIEELHLLFDRTGKVADYGMVKGRPIWRVPLKLMQDAA
jgi:hypothetical protein